MMPMLLTKLMAAGLGSGLANAFTADTADNQTATGTNQATAFETSTAFVRFSTVASGTGTLLDNGARGDSQFIINDGANALAVYPHVGGSINGLGTNAAFSIAAGSWAMFGRYTDARWVGGNDAASLSFLQSGSTQAETVSAALQRIVYADQFTTFAEALTAAVGHRLHIRTAITISADTSIAATIDVDMEKGGSFAVASGKTLTLNCPFKAPWVQVFSGAGVVTFANNEKVGAISPLWWGATFDNSTNDYAALQACITAARGGMTIELPPASKAKFGTGLVIPDEVLNIKGGGLGAGSYFNSVLDYTGTGGTALTHNGYYSTICGVEIHNTGTGAIGIKLVGNRLTLDKVTIYPTARVGGVGFSTAGVQNTTGSDTFTHTLRDCYIGGNTIGWDCARGNNMVSDHSFFEGNTTNIRVGNSAVVSGFAFVNGSVNEVGLLASESATAKGIDIVSARAITIRDGYHEANSIGNAGLTGQRCVNLQTVDGGTIESNYMTSGSSVDILVNGTSTAKNVKVQNNFFKNAVTAVNRQNSSTLALDGNSQSGITTLSTNTGTPTFTNLTVVNGTGGATYTCVFERAADRIFFTAQVTVTGTCTTAAASAYFTLAAMPTPAAIDVLHVSDYNVANIGVGIIDVDGRFYVPGWTARNVNIFISGSYRITP